MSARISIWLSTDWRGPCVASSGGNGISDAAECRPCTMTQVVVRLTKLVAKSSLSFCCVALLPILSVISTAVTAASLFNTPSVRGEERGRHFRSHHCNTTCWCLNTSLVVKCQTVLDSNTRKKTTTSCYNSNVEWKLLCDEQLYCLNTTLLI